jgi:hypothetical protein
MSKTLQPLTCRFFNALVLTQNPAALVEHALQSGQDRLCF